MSVRFRVVSFANSAITIETHGARAAALVEFLFRDMPMDDQIVPHVAFRLMPATPLEQLAVYRDNTLMLTSNSDAPIAEYLLGEASFHLADKSQGGLLLHAGALAWHEHGILIPGSIGAGKTTLTAWLMARGLDYLTDEMVFVPDASDVVHPFVRPLNLKPGSRIALQTIFDFESFTALIHHSPSADLVSPLALRSTNRLSAPRVRLMLFPQYAPEVAFEIQPLSKAQAGFALMQSLLNARNLPDHGLPHIARLAQAAPAYRLRYAQFAQISTWLDELLRQLV